MTLTADYAAVNESVLKGLRRPSPAWFALVAACGIGIFAALGAWIYQVHAGMGVAGINHPVGWGVYIADYVFWIAVAMAGSFVSGMLYLVRARFRSAVSRAAETMTFFAVIAAGLFPLIHLGRVWVFYYVMPYPSQRELWPNFQSPLFWDLMAIGSYLTASWIFYFVGLIPDLATVADHGGEHAGAHPLHRAACRLLSGNFSFSAREWRHYDRSYLLFAALVTPLAVSIHTVTSWIFGMGILPGWHSTIFAPYFVAGAVLSGSAMALTILIPLRRALGLETVITGDHLGAMAKIVAAAALLVGYTYCIEPFAAWYSRNLFERQFSVFLATGWIAPAYWALGILNVAVPLALLVGRVRARAGLVFAIALLINIGMWLERVVIVTSATSHDFLPHNWGAYMPRWPEIVITAGSFSLVFGGILVFAKILPMAAIADVKEALAPVQNFGSIPPGRCDKVGSSGPVVRALFNDADALLRAAIAAKQAGITKLELFSPFPLAQAGGLLGLRASPVGLWTLAGCVLGGAGGLILGWWSSQVNGLSVGGKPPGAWPGLLPAAFEFAMVTGVLFNAAGLVFHARLLKGERVRGYDPRFSAGAFGLIAGGSSGELETARSVIEPFSRELHGPE
jgi:molybdopterin-containing oxidoreductase family membrane subunit